MFNPSQLAVALAAAGMAASVQANDVYELDRIVVSASRTAQTVDQALAPVSVITREEIERSQASSVTELLNRTPGMQIAGNGGPGSKAGVYLRGTKTAQTLVLIDGIPVRSGDFGEAPLQFLDPDQVERIEIVRGPKSGLYGPDAVGGVIQIFTRQGKGDPQARIKLGIGSRGTGEYGINYGGEVDGTRFNIGAKLFETSGYDRTFNTSGTDGDDDAYRNKSVSGNVSRKFSDDFEAGLRFSHATGKSEYDNNSDFDGYPYSLFDITNVSGFLSKDVNDLWSTNLDLGFGHEKRDDRGSQFPGHATTKRYTTSWKNDLAWTDSQFMIAGIDYQNESISGNNDFAIDQRYNVGVFAQNTSSFDWHELQLGLRHDKNESYGYNTTGSVSWGIDLPADMKFVSSYGTAFRAPTFYDLYGPMGANPDLKAETSESIEFELRGTHASISWSVNVFQNQMKDMLEFNMDTFKMENIDEARIRGIELAASTEMFGWLINTNATFLDPENRSGIHDGKTLMRRATQLFTLNADKVVGDWTLGGTFRAQNSTWNDAGNTDRVAGFGTFDLRGGYRFSPQFQTELKVVNLMDKEYSTTRGYRSEPRGAFATFIWSPKF